LFSLRLKCQWWLYHVPNNPDFVRYLLIPLVTRGMIGMNPVWSKLIKVFQNESNPPCQRLVQWQSYDKSTSQLDIHETARVASCEGFLILRR
jgi:hypothetical protein